MNHSTLQQTGFTFFEVLISCVLLSIALFSVTALELKSAQFIQLAKHEARLVETLENQTEKPRAASIFFRIHLS